MLGSLFRICSSNPPAWLSALVLAALLTGPSLPLAAAPAKAASPSLDLRVALLLEEMLDGAVQPVSRGEAALLEPLLAAGFLMLDPARLAELRAQNSVGDLLAGSKLQGPHAEDVDLLIVGRLEAFKVGEKVLGTEMNRYDCAFQGKVVAADTGQLLQAFNVRGQGTDTTDRGAALMAFEQGGKKAASEIVARSEAIRAADRMLTLLARDIPDPAELAQVTAALAGLPGVEQVVPRTQSTKESRFDLKVKGLSARSLAEQITATQGVGLTVEGFTTRRLRTAYDLRRRLKLPVLLGPFQNRSGFPEDDWLRHKLPELLEARLGDSGLIDVRRAPGSAEGADLRRQAEEQGCLLLLEGWFTNQGSRAVLGLELRRVDTGKSLLKVERKGSSQSFGQVMHQAAAEVPGSLFGRVVADRALLAASGVGKLPAGFKGKGQRGEGLRIAELQLPAGLPRPESGGAPLLGSVVLDNGLGEALSQVEVRLVSDAGTLMEKQVDLPARGQTTVDLRSEIPASQLQQDSLTLRLEVVGQRGDEELVQRVRHPLVMLSPGGTWLSAR